MADILRTYEPVHPTLVLAALCSPATPTPAPAQASVDLRLTSADTPEARLLEVLLRQRLTDRLSQDGHRLVPTGEQAAVSVWVHVDGDGARVRTRGTQRREEIVPSGDPEVVVLEILQLASALVDEALEDQTDLGDVAPTVGEEQVQADALAAPAIEEVFAEPSGLIADDESHPAQPASQNSFAATMHSGAIARAGGVDGSFGLRLRAGRRRGLGGGLELMVVPSSGQSLRVVETLPTALLDWRLGVREHGLATLGAFGGLHVHSFVQTRLNGGRGVRVAPSLGAVVRASYLGERGLLAFGGFRAGYFGGRWVHTLDGAATWHRSALLVTAELGVGWDFAWRRRQ